MTKSILLQPVFHILWGKDPKNGEALKCDQIYSTPTRFHILWGKDTENGEALVKQVFIFSSKYLSHVKSQKSIFI